MKEGDSFPQEYWLDIKQQFLISVWHKIPYNWAAERLEAEGMWKKGIEARMHGMLLVQHCPRATSELFDLRKNSSFWLSHMQLFFFLFAMKKVFSKLPGWLCPVVVPILKIICSLFHYWHISEADKNWAYFFFFSNSKKILAESLSCMLLGDKAFCFQICCPTWDVDTRVLGRGVGTKGPIHREPERAVFSVPGTIVEWLVSCLGKGYLLPPS